MEVMVILQLYNNFYFFIAPSHHHPKSYHQENIYHNTKQQTTTYSKSYQQEPKFIKHNNDVLIMKLPNSESGQSFQAWSWSSPSPRSLEGKFI